MNEGSPSPVLLELTEAGRDWLNEYDLRHRGKDVGSFYADDVWAEILRCLMRGPASVEATVNAIQDTRLVRVIPVSEIRKSIALLLEYGYIAPH